MPKTNDSSSKHDDSVRDVLLVDDHPMIREGLRALFDSQEDFRVVGEASGESEAIAKCMALHPSLVMLDLALGAEGGLRLVSALRRESSTMSILVFSVHSELVFAARAIDAGANGFVPKNAGTETILRAARRTLAGRNYVSERVSDHLLAAMSASGPGTSPSAAVKLTNREVEVLRYVAEGMTAKDIGARLALSAKTIETHRARIMTKLGVSRAGELVSIAATMVHSGELTREGGR